MEALQGFFLTIIQLSFLIVGLLTVSTTTPTPAAAQALPNCPDQCGSLKVPYPFGMTDACAYQGIYFVNCSYETDPPTAYLTKGGSLVVTNISLETGELQISSHITRDCYDSSGLNTFKISPSLRLPSILYTISDTKNKFIAIGCDTRAIFQGSRGTDVSLTGCESVCNSLDNVVNNSCSGVGCCQADIPIGRHDCSVTLSSKTNHSGISDFNPCSFAFIVEETKFNFSGESSFQQLQNNPKVPAVINWAIGDDESYSCDVVGKKTDYACKQNSKCLNLEDRDGYICQCLPGYEGNPYHPYGCHDIDECKSLNICNNGKCTNTAGNFSCICSKGFEFDGNNCIKGNAKSKSKITLVLTISLGASIGLMLLFIGKWICCSMKRRQFIKLKEKYFTENGGLLLQPKLASHGGTIDTTKIFTAEELEKATNNYHESRILGEGGFGTVYKAILQDNQVVAIKKPKMGSPAKGEQFVNEIIVLSQVNHRNVVRLLGCCLETEVPLLVYEFITHGTLFEHIHKKEGKGSSFSWQLRLKIASETAGALAYLHSSTSTPIIHRDVKTMNILLDENYTAKVSDFGASRFIPLDQTQLATLVQGTFGYLDPEYFQSNQLTEKSDVYSFGVVLAELLTSKVALSFARPEAERSLAQLFVCSVQDGHLNQILYDDIVREGDINQGVIDSVANLAKRCLRPEGDKRPTMKEVAMELEGIRITTKHPWDSTDNFASTRHLLGSPDTSKDYSVNINGDGGHGTTSGCASMQSELLMSYADGR